MEPRLIRSQTCNCQDTRSQARRLLWWPDRMVAETVAALGDLDIAVNNAGVNKNNAAEDTPESEWDLTFSVNTKGLFLCCQACPRF